jgi:hypothetical protein
MLNLVKLILLAMLVTANPSLVGRWRIEKAVLAGELFYDRNDTTITKQNFLERQRRSGDAAKKYFSAISKSFSFDTYNRNGGRMGMQFFENGEFELTSFYASTEHIEKGRYRLLFEKKEILLTQDGVTDTLTIDLSETRMELTGKPGAFQSKYLYSRVQ